MLFYNKMSSLNWSFQQWKLLCNNGLFKLNTPHPIYNKQIYPSVCFCNFLHFTNLQETISAKRIFSPIWSIHFWIFDAEFDVRSAKFDVGANDNVGGKVNVGDDMPNDEENMKELRVAGYG